MKRVFRGRHTVLSNHHFRIRIVYSLNHPFSGFSGFKIEGYCTVYKIKRHSAPLIVRPCLSIRKVVSLNSFDPGTPGTLITTHACVWMCTRVLSQGRLFTVPMDCSPPDSSAHGIFSKNTGVGCHFLLQGIFPMWSIEPTSLVSPAFAGRFFTTAPSGKPMLLVQCF